MNPEVFILVQFKFWMWVCVGKDVYKKATLYTYRESFPDSTSLRDIQMRCEFALSEFRQRNYGVAHSEIYGVWNIIQNVNP